LTAVFHPIWSFYHHHVIASGRQTAFFLLAAFLLSFAGCRVYTRLARVRGWGSAHAGDVHIHHMVVGIVFLLAAGFLDFAADPSHPWIDLLAILFGVGAGLTLDEFALWLHLEDVYWSEDGRKSIDAVIVATLVGGLVFIGVAPFGVEERGSIAGTVATILLVLICSSVAFTKGKFLLGVTGLFIPVVALVAAVRLARPGSPWARRLYGRNETKARKALAREEKRTARKVRLRNLIGGAPDVPKLPPAA
jgi:hypothetical protein